MVFEANCFSRACFLLFVRLGLFLLFTKGLDVFLFDAYFWVGCICSVRCFSA
jgi:hypothetical protein